MALKPVLFFQDMPKSSWREEPLSFAMITSWILALALTVIVFFNNYLPTGLTLIEGIQGQKLLIVVPVLAVMGFAFFAMTALILVGLMNIAVIGLMIFCAAVLNLLLVLLGGKGTVFEVVKASFYASATLLAGLINIVLMVAVKYKLMSFTDWISGERVIYYCACVYIYGLFSIIGRKTHNVPRWKAFLAATVPLVILVMVNIFLSSKVLPKLAGFLG